MKKSSARKRGLTLVEMLVTLTLTSMIAVIIISSLQTSTRLWTRMSAASGATAEMTFVHGFLRRAVEYSYPRLKQDGSGDVDFSGSATSLEFLGPVIPGVTEAGRARISLAVRKAGAGEQLVLTLRNGLATDITPTRETLISRARLIRFSYRARGSAEWVDEWRRQPSLPALVRISVEAEDGRSKNWPPLIIRPLIGADVDCRIDAITGGCVGRRS